MGSQNPSIKALVKLIDDPDEDIFHHVRDELKMWEQGHSVS